MKPQIIALYSSIPQSGKSSIARRLRDAHGYTIVSFADPIKRTAEAFLQACGMCSEESRRLVYEDKDEKFTLAGLSLTGRRILQTLGTEWGRGCIAEDLWIRVAIGQATRCPLVIDDLRFPNEYEAVRSAGGLVVRVVRPGRSADDDTRKHTSEGRLDSFSFDAILSPAEGRDALWKAADSLVDGVGVV